MKEVYKYLIFCPHCNASQGYIPRKEITKSSSYRCNRCGKSHLVKNCRRIPAELGERVKTQKIRPLI